MFHYRMLVIGVVASLGVISLIVWFAIQARALNNLPVERTNLGRAPDFAFQKLTYYDVKVMPVDLDNNGETELLLSFGMRSFGSSKDLQRVSVWTDLRGNFSEVPCDVAYPYTVNLLAPQTVPREVIGRDRAQRHLLRLSLEQSRWKETPVAGSPQTKVFIPHWRDGDGDGYLDSIRVRLKGQQPIDLRLNAALRWETFRSERLAPELPLAFLNMNPQVASTLADLGQNVWLGDLDGDGAADQLDLERRVVRLARGTNLRFSASTADWEQFLIAELDGRAPAELVYLSHRQGHSPTLTVFRLQGDALKQAAQETLITLYPQGYVRDSNGDGQSELIVGGIDTRARQFAIVRFRWRAGGLFEDLRSLTSGVRWQGSAELRYIQPSTTLAFATLAEHGWLRRSTETHTVVASPNLEKFSVLRGEPVWAGDYDGDGNEEYVLSHPQGGIIAQFRENQWLVARIRHDAPITAAVAVQRQGKPTLILVYGDGVIEAVDIKR